MNKYTSKYTKQRHERVGERLRNRSIAALQTHHRLIGLDIVRALAIIMVLLEHTIPVTPGSTADCWIKTLAAPDAVLFIMLSGALLLPVTSVGPFMRRRASRVLIPFLMWSVLYAVLNYFFISHSTYWLAEQVRWCWLTETFHQGWFVPALLGVYLFMPIISPWIERATFGQLKYFLLLWLGATTLPLLTLIMGVEDYSTGIFGPFFNFNGYAVAGYCLMRYPLARLSPFKRLLLAAIMLFCAIGLPILLSGGELRSTWGGLISNNMALPTALFALCIFGFIAPIRHLSPRAERFARPVIELFATNAWVIYLAHPLFMQFVIPQLFPSIVSTWWAVALTFGGSLLLAVTLKRLPILRYMFT